MRRLNDQFPQVSACRTGSRPLLAAGLALLLTGCFPDNQKEQASVGDAGKIPLTRDQVVRAQKGDRLAKTQAVSVGQPRPAARTSPHASPLSKFYRALSDLNSGWRTKPVTVVHLGDSHIAADRFSGDLRSLFQARFGSAGRGMMMPGFPFPYYRARGVSFDKSGKWTAANSFKGDTGPYGITGVRLETKDKDALLRLEKKDGPAEWAEVAFLAHDGGGDAIVTFGGATRSVKTAAGRHGVQRVRIEKKGKTLEIKAVGNGSLKLLSVATGHHHPGLRYVNFGIPGATADTPRKWDAALLASDLAALEPDLIVMSYGTNEGFNDGLDMPAYEARVTALVGKLRSYAGNPSVLIIAPPDGARLPRFARKKGSDVQHPCRALSESERADYKKLKTAKSDQLARWHAPPKLAAVRASLKTVAAKAGAQFWDWSQVMGGPCGIHEWTKGEKPLAASDRVHLRSAGAKRSADALFAELMKGYEAHTKVASGESRAPRL